MGKLALSEAAKESLAKADTALQASDIAGLVNDQHTHSNKALLDTYAQTEANLADAVSKKHSHDNKAVIDGITAAKVSAWDSAEQNAKNYADGIVEQAKNDASNQNAVVLAEAQAYADGLAGNYATKKQGERADTALQPEDLHFNITDSNSDTTDDNGAIGLDITVGDGATSGSMTLVAPTNSGLKIESSKWQDGCV
jgi:hypothetical protein